MTEGDFEQVDFSDRDVDAVVLAGALVHIPHERFQAVLENDLRLSDRAAMYRVA